MKRTITGLFDSRDEAEAVIRHLVSSVGLSESHVRIHGAEAGTATAATHPAEEKGFWASLGDLFVPDEDRYAYSEGIRRGGYLVTADVEEGQLDHVMDVFEQHGAVDLDSREAEWRSSGWKGYEAHGQDAVLPAGSKTVTTDRAGMTGAAAVPAATQRRKGTGTGNEEVIPIVEEQVKIGKRDIERGRVRVRSYVVETPVSEQVTLRDETVSVERRAVDLPLSAADDAFRDRVIEAVEHDEEAVVSKDARVKEEMVVRKDATQRTETVTDKVRRTEVEVEDERGRVSGATGATRTPKV